MWLLLMFVAIPLIEIGLFIQVGGAIGVWPTLALVLLGAVLGVIVMRANAARTSYEGQRALAELRDPTRPLAHGALVMLAGALLVLPGFFTDAIGLLLLIPAVRDLVMRRIGRRVQVQTAGFAGMRPEPHRPPFQGGIIDGDYTVEDDDDPRRPPGPPDTLPPDVLPPGGGSGWTRS
ncbi:MAG: FxsA family protein [Paracoccus sp. (in: a-proteobacteria)]|uniref:FxsA family protein n=1 Tax=Paracoccus sp. TaxID=267 RepID=UPI0026DFD17A|nr:FxsA family protein [Paracoccus sp. (in: a-proteobacteria)]MDO5632549.1 FxsA family protein [Paracoccus sp. (in: a-proteobacteria)]